MAGRSLSCGAHDSNVCDVIDVVVTVATFSIVVGCEFFAPGQPGAGHCHNPAATNAEGVGAAEACPTTCAKQELDGGARAVDSLAEALGGAIAVGQASCNWEVQNAPVSQTAADIL